MSSQLDILALEPFYGGIRRHMLETIVRCSRHRWTVLKLPPRRIERRLSAAANWFAEQLSRHWVGRLDLLFTSEAMNLASLFQLMPALARHPSVVYFHDNQLPEHGGARDNPLDLVNLNTASAATELWFNSNYHKRTFLARAGAMVDRHPELSARSPMADIIARSRLMSPPIDLRLVSQIEAEHKAPRNPRQVFFETRDADVGLLNESFKVMRRQGVEFSAVTVGPVDALDPAVDRVTIAEHDDRAQVSAMIGSGVVLSAKPEAVFDYQVIRALSAGCRPALPDAGVYPELVPKSMHGACLYEISPEGLAETLADAIDGKPHPDQASLRNSFKAFDAIGACRAFDERVEQLVGQHRLKS